MLSGGELQRFAIGIVAVQDADVYMFDEPSSYLDVKQRLKVWWWSHVESWIALTPFHPLGLYRSAVLIDLVDGDDARHHW